MKLFINVLTVLVILGGMLFLATSILADNPLTGTHSATVAIALFAFAGLMMFESRPSQ